MALPPPSAFAEMSGDHAQSSASRTSEEGDREDEFGYSWSKLSFCNAFNCQGYLNSSVFLKADAG